MAAKLTALDEEKLVRLYGAGENQLALARQFGISRPTVLRVLVAHQVPLHSRTAVQQRLSDARDTETKKRMTEAAHVARRGQSDDFETLFQRARTRQERGLGASAAERQLAEWLRERGIETVPQQAIGPYNTDLGAAPVAVEVFGGTWHSGGRHGQRSPERLRYILDQGWNLAIVWVVPRAFEFTTAAADYLAAFVEQSRRGPAFRGQHRVIWSDGEPTSTNGLEIDHLSDVPSRRRG